VLLHQPTEKTMDKVAAFLESKQPKVTATDERDKDIRKVAEYSQMMNDDIVLNSMSPESRDQYLAALRKQRKDVLSKFSSTNSD
jgi:hypothetical protein